MVLMRAGMCCVFVWITVTDTTLSLYFEIIKSGQIYLFSWSHSVGVFGILTLILLKYSWKHWRRAVHQKSQSISRGWRRILFAREVVWCHLRLSGINKCDLLAGIDVSNALEGHYELRLPFYRPSTPAACETICEGWQDASSLEALSTTERLHVCE